MVARKTVSEINELLVNKNFQPIDGWISCKEKYSFVCKKCNNVVLTTLDGINKSKIGCKYCAKNAPPSELDIKKRLSGRNIEMINSYY